MMSTKPQRHFMHFISRFSRITALGTATLMSRDAAEGARRPASPSGAEKGNYSYNASIHETFGSFRFSWQFEKVPSAFVAGQQGTDSWNAGASVTGQQALTRTSTGASRPRRAGSGARARFWASAVLIP